MLHKCIYKGGSLCQRHGGSGSLKHSTAYRHPYQSSTELGVVKGITASKQDNGVTVPGTALESWFNEDAAERALLQEYSGVVNSVDIVKKSLYDFDVTSIEGIDKLLYLLPILDNRVVELVSQELWPGYPIDDNFDHKKVRLEIKGFLLDFIYGFEEKFNTSGTGFADGFSEQDNEQAGVTDPGPVPDPVG